MSRRQRSTRSEGVHPTRAAILEVAMTVLVEDGFDRFSVQRVLDGAGVSRATLYNHFDDVDTLIEDALVAVFAREGAVNRQRFDDLMATATDRAGFVEVLHGFLTAFGRFPAEVRMRRAHTIALGATRPSLASALAQVQDEVTTGWLSTIEEAQRRGFIRADIDALALAVMIQGITLGRIIDDAATDPIGDERWTAMFIELIDRMVLTPE